MRIEPSVSPRLEFFVLDADSAAVSSLTHTDVTSAAYVLTTAGVDASGVSVALSSSVASTATVSAGQFVTIDSARGHYAVDCPAGAALSTADTVRLSIVMVDGTQLVRVVSHAIDNATSEVLEDTAEIVADTQVMQPLVSALYGEQIIYSGVTTGTGTTTSIEASALSSTNKFADCLIMMLSGAAVNEPRPIASHTGGVITLDEALTAAAGSGVSFNIYRSHIHPINQIQSGLALEATSQTLLTNIGTPTDTDIATDIANVKTVADAVLVDTDVTIPGLFSSIISLNLMDVQ